LRSLKLGEKLKFIKYLLINDPPPEIDKKNELLNYFKKTLKLNESLIDNINNGIENLLLYNEEEIEQQFDEWQITNNYERFKIMIILKLIKQKKYKSSEEFDRVIKSNNNLNYYKFNSNNSNEDINTNNTESYKSINENENDNEDEYLLYSTIEVYNHITSEDEVENGLKNPIDEFKKICNDFHIKFDNDDCTFIDYNEAKKTKLSSFMLWGSKESLYNYFTNHKIKKAYDYFKKNENNGGIYFCININKYIGYLIIWPGKLKYIYSKIDEPNNNILLTLISYGFYLSSNSILCLTDNEINNFDFHGFEIPRYRLIYF